MVTVPACFQCNSGASRYDESFRTYLSLHVGITDQRRLQLFNNTLSSLNHNRRLLNEVLGSSQKIPFTTPAGIFVGNGLRVIWNSRVHDAVVERCIRGLYYHHFGSVLADQAKISVQWLRKVPLAPAEMRKLTLIVIAADQFTYHFARSPDEPLRSIWIFNFYGRHFASGYTEPRNDA